MDRKTLYRKSKLKRRIENCRCVIPFLTGGEPSNALTKVMSKNWCVSEAYVCHRVDHQLFSLRRRSRLIHAASASTACRVRQAISRCTKVLDVAEADGLAGRHRRSAAIKRAGHCRVHSKTACCER